jgi:hypothetical protein
MALSGRTVELVIDELVLDGVDAGDPAVRGALEQTLGPALAEHGLAASTGDVTSAVTSAVADGASR